MRSRAAALSLALAFSSCFPLLAGAQPAGQTFIRGTVTHVEDGDTLTISVGRDRYSIRLADIDAPETCHPVTRTDCKRPGQPLGPLATQALSDMSLGRPAVAVCRGASYNRTVCFVDVGGKDLSTELALAGLVWWESRYSQAGKASRASSRAGDPPDSAASVRAARVKAAESAARFRQVGLWAPLAPGSPPHIEPWTWRRMCWDGGVCPVAKLH